VNKPKALIAWSSGKDSAWALHQVRKAGTFEVVGALTTITDTFARVSMHGVREQLLAAQLAAAGLPSVPVRIPYPCPNDAYEAAMLQALAAAKAAAVTHVIFGDLFLRDIRAYREERLRLIDMQPIFPLWDLPTKALAHDMIAGGLSATLVCVDLKALPARFAGRAFDASLLAELPTVTDPCGENGEFHTFVTAGPMLCGTLDVQVAGITERDGFAFADLLPAAPMGLYCESKERRPRAPSP
jgi:diphthamide synthase (EF-2-diphthine--ammonia ligase)